MREPTANPDICTSRRALRVLSVLSLLLVSGGATLAAGPAQAASVSYRAIAASASPALAPGDYTIRLTHAGQQRSATVHVPRGYDGGSLSTLVHFPGLYEEPWMANLFSKLSAHADENGYLVVIPAHYGVGWQGVPGGVTSPDVDDPGFIRALLDVLVQQYHADPQRLYASGMSNGGFFTHKTACELSDRFAAFAAVSGQLPTALAQTCTPVRPLPILMIHGTNDPVVAYDVDYAPVTAAANFWARHNPCTTTRTSTDLPNTVLDFTSVTRHEYQGCTANAPVVLYDVNNGGHHWPGGIPFLPPPALGWQTYDISANTVIWDFVSRFQLTD